ncbi:MAG: recombinase family protein [Bacillota bacterium]
MNYTTGVDKQRVAVYIRWSTEEQGDGTTLEVQQEACRLFIQSQGWVYREDLVFVDDGWSGGSLDRPGLNRLRAAVAEGLISCVVVYKLDRLSRSVLDTVNLVLQEWDGVCSIRSTREPVDTTNPAGSILFYMLASYAEWERATIRERTMSGKIKRAQQGKNPGFTPPYGYTRGEEPGQWAVEPLEAAVLRRIFREYIGGRGIHTIAAGLNADGIRPRRADFWRGETIIKMINNPVYTGLLRYGLSTLTTRAQRKQLGKFRLFFDEPRYASVEGAVPVIIPRAEWELAQRVRESRGATVGTRARGATFLLTGIARCRCGATVRGDDRGESKRYYRCANSKLRCDGGLVSARMLEDAVLQQVRAALEPTSRELLIASWREEAARQAAEAAAEMERLRGELAEVEKAQARVTRDYREGDLPARIFAVEIDRLDREADRLRGALAGMAKEARRLQAADWSRTDLEGMAARLDAWECLSPEEQKQLLRHFVARCVVYRARSGRGVGVENTNPVAVELELRMAEQ